MLSCVLLGRGGHPPLLSEYDKEWIISLAQVRYERLITCCIGIHCYVQRCAVQRPSSASAEQSQKSMGCRSRYYCTHACVHMLRMHNVPQHLPTLSNLS
jgi:hypothetical protein